MIRVIVRPVLRAGFEQWQAVATRDGAVVHQVIRWSEAFARTEMARWLAKREQPGGQSC
jgi:hypothetical protein